MRDGFTLIELLIVLVVMVLVMGVVIPKGAKMMEKYQRNFDNMKKKQQLIKAKSESFLTLKEQVFTIDKKQYVTTIKGVILEKRNDNY